MKFVRYKFPFGMAGVAMFVLGALWGTFLRRFGSHPILEGFLIVVGTIVIVGVVYYRPSFK